MNDTSTQSAPHVGLVGLGLLGSAIAERLIRSSFHVIGFDLSIEARRHLASIGGVAAQSAQEVFENCNRVCLSLPDHNVVESLLAGVATTPGQTVIDTSTGDPSASERLAALLGSRGVDYIDATISGSSEQTRAGSAVLMVGGSPSSVAACHDLLVAIAERVFHTGPVGSGARMKLVTNLVLGLNRAALAEGLALGKSMGINLDQLLEVLRSGPASSRIMDAKGPKMIAREYSPQARLSQHLKDVRLMIGAAEQLGATVPLSTVHRMLLEEAESLGLGGLDNSAIYETYWKRTDHQE